MRLRVITFLAAVSTFLFILCSPAAAFDFLATPCKTAPNSNVCQTKPTGQNPAVNTIHDAANIIAVAAAIGAVVMIIIGGLGYITSGDNPEGLKAARQRIIYSLVGVVIIALAWTITRFITDNLIK